MPLAHPCRQLVIDAVIDHLGSLTEFYSTQCAMRGSNMLDQLALAGRSGATGPFHLADDQVHPTRAAYIDDLLTNYTDESFKCYVLARGGSFYIGDFEVARYLCCYSGVPAAGQFHHL